MRIIIAISILAAFAVSCVTEPDAPKDDSDLSPAESGTYVLCEGLWGYGNSSLTRFEFAYSSSVGSFFEKRNGRRLGDVANSISRSGDKGFIVVSASLAIEAIDLRSGESLGTLRFPNGSQPREMCFVDSVAFVTDLYKHSIIEIDPFGLKIIGEPIAVGPAPEGILHFERKLLVANSGYGDYLAHLPKAGTISVVDLAANREIETIEVGPNLTEIEIDRNRGLIFAMYKGLPSERPDSLGGIVAIDAKTYETNASVRGLFDAFAFDGNRYIYAVADSKLIRIDVETFESATLAESENEDVWYDLEVNLRDGSVWICNARNHQINGEIVVFEIFNDSAVEETRIPAGINPANVLFF